MLASAREFKEGDEDTFQLKTLFQAFTTILWTKKCSLNQLKLSRFPDKVLKYIGIIFGG